MSNCTFQKNEFDTEEGKKWILGLLFERQVNITFVKKNGEPRDILCTLNEELMKKNATPDCYEVKGVGKKPSDTSQPVFDLEKLAWRSFRWDSVTKIEFTL